MIMIRQLKLEHRLVTANSSQQALKFPHASQECWKQTAKYISVLYDLYQINWRNMNTFIEDLPYLILKFKIKIFVCQI